MDIDELITKIQEHMYHTLSVNPSMESEESYNLSLYCETCETSIFDTAWTI
jgi:hypothetical protein